MQIFTSVGKLVPSAELLSSQPPKHAKRMLGEVIRAAMWDTCNLNLHFLVFLYLSLRTCGILQCETAILLLSGLGCSTLNETQRLYCLTVSHPQCYSINILIKNLTSRFQHALLAPHSHKICSRVLKINLELKNYHKQFLFSKGKIFIYNRFCFIHINIANTFWVVLYNSGYGFAAVRAISKPQWNTTSLSLAHPASNSAGGLCSL